MPRVSSRALVSWFVTLALSGLVPLTLLRVAGTAEGIWPVPPALAFTAYLVPLAAVVAVAALALRRRVAAALALVSGAALVAVIAPRAAPHEQPAASPRTVRVMSANLLHGGADPRALAALVREHRPDVLALQEISPPTARRLRAAGVFATLPHVLTKSGATWNDTGLAARFPIAQRELGLPSVYLAGDLALPGGTSVPVVSAHPTPPMNPGAQRRWRDWLAALPAPRGPLSGAIVAGDFNATLDHAGFRQLLGRGWRDAAEESGRGLEPTWEGAVLLRLTLDHVLVPPGAAVRGFRTDPLPGSDHRVVTATIALPRATR